MRFQHVKDIKALIADLPDHMVLLQEGGDHEMFPVFIAVGDVHCEKEHERSARLRYAPFDLDGNTNHKALVVTR